jgi:hypothetical protein
VTWQFFDVLGVKPMLGRGFTSEEDRQGANRVIVMGHDTWASRFGSDRSIVGRDITVNGVSYLVAGVLRPPSLFAPGSLGAAGYDASHHRLPRRHCAWWHAQAGRLAVRPATQRRASTTARAVPNKYAGPGTVLASARIRTRHASAPLAVVGLVALIASATRPIFSSVARCAAGEFALRVALGASRGRLATLLITEGFLIALAAAVLGSLFAVMGVDVLLRMAPDGLPRLNQVKVDGVVLAFAAGLALLTGVVASIVPGWALLRGGLQTGVRLGARSVVGAGRHNLRGGLVAAEMALAVMLISGTSLLFGSVSRLLAVNAGFSTPDRLSCNSACRVPASPTVEQ